MAGGAVPAGLDSSASPSYRRCDPVDYPPPRRSGVLASSPQNPDQLPVLHLSSEISSVSAPPSNLLSGLSSSAESGLLPRPRSQESWLEEREHSTLLPADDSSLLTDTTQLPEECFLPSTAEEGQVRRRRSSSPPPAPRDLPAREGLPIVGILVN